MRKTSRSIQKFVREALDAGADALPSYSHPKSPQRYTQAQLFALIALRRALKLDYRGLIDTIRNAPAMRKALRLSRLPHYSTIAKAEDRLLANRAAASLLDNTLRRARRAGVAPQKSERASRSRSRSERMKQWVFRSAATRFPGR